MILIAIIIIMCVYYYYYYICHIIISPSLQVTGVVLLSVGLWWKFMLAPYMALISRSPDAPYVMTGTGVAIVLFGLFGCFATCRGRPWMLKLVSNLYITSA